MKYLYMSLGGVLGVVSRYLVGGFAARFLGLGFPYGTFVVNVSGCLAIGFLATLGNTQWYISPNARAFVFIGFLGAYTTFSTYMLESYELMHRGEWMTGLTYILLSVALGMTAFVAGVAAARWI